MAHLSIQQIRQLAEQIVSQNASGIRYTDLANQIKSQHPETPIHSIFAAIVSIDRLLPHSITKPSRGLYVPITATGQGNAANPLNVLVPPSNTSPASNLSKILEHQFYQPFADFLTGDLGEVIVAESLGGGGLGKKWGTPDVVGVYKPLASDRVQFAKEIVSAEIKIDPAESVTAFGQAVAYRLFSTKVYVVMPRTVSPDDQSRLEALCMLFGVGFVLFDLDINNPNFVTRIRAQRSAPDIFYVNVFAEQLHKHDPVKFQTLFA